MTGSNGVADGHLATEIANDRFWSAASAGRRCGAVDRFEPFSGFGARRSIAAKGGTRTFAATGMNASSADDAVA
jgi:hypothetical protein